MDKEAQDHKFNWGDSVVIAKNAPEKYHPSEIGFICGMIDIDSEEAALAYDCIGSDWLYTVELLPPTKQKPLHAPMQLRMLGYCKKPIKREYCRV